MSPMSLATQVSRHHATPEYFTVTQMAARLQVCPDTVRRLARLRKLPGQKFGGEWRFPAEAMEHTHPRPVAAWDAVPDPVQTYLPPLRLQLANVITLMDATVYRPTPALIDILRSQLRELADAAQLVREILAEPAKDL